MTASAHRLRCEEDQRSASSTETRTYSQSDELRPEPGEPPAGPDDPLAIAPRRRLARVSLAAEGASPVVAAIQAMELHREDGRVASNADGRRGTAVRSRACNENADQDHGRDAHRDGQQRVDDEPRWTRRTDSVGFGCGRVSGRRDRDRRCWTTADRVHGSDLSRARAGSRPQDPIGSSLRSIVAEKPRSTGLPHARRRRLTARAERTIICPCIGLTTRPVAVGARLRQELRPGTRAREWHVCHGMVSETMAKQRR